MQCILVKSDEFQNSYPLLYILCKSCLCCCSLTTLAPQQIYIFSFFQWHACKLAKLAKNRSFLQKISPKFPKEICEMKMCLPSNIFTTILELYTIMYFSRPLILLWCIMWLRDERRACCLLVARKTWGEYVKMVSCDCTFTKSI